MSESELHLSQGAVQEEDAQDCAFDQVRKSLPDERMLYDLADVFRIFGDTTRIKILYAMYGGELCVQHLAQVLGASQSAVSHQLRIL